MRSKLHILLLLVSILAPPSQTHASTMGVVIRPTFFKNAAAYFNARELSFPFENQVGSFQVSGRLGFKLSSPEWNAHANNLLFLQTKIEMLSLAATLIHKSGNTYRATGELQSLEVRVVIDPQGITTEGPSKHLVSTDLVPTPDNAFNPKISFFKEGSTEPFKELLSLGDMNSLKSFLWSRLKETVDERFSQWIFERLRRSVVVEPLSKVMGDSPLWKEGPVFSKGGLTIEMDGPAINQRETIFASYPFLKGNVFVSDHSLEFYSRASFVQPEFLSDLLGQRSRNLSLEQIVTEVEEHLKNPNSWDSEAFVRQQIPVAESELSLVIPSTLINEALSTFYRRGLLRFKTRSHLGKQTQGLLTPEAPEVYSVVGISPRSAPEILFEPDRTHLKIVDYALDVSTDIEDRLIPSASILTNASVFANLAVDTATQTVNLKMAPETFSIVLADQTGRMTPDQMSVFEKLADSLWQEFLSVYPSLVLFTAPLETQQAGVKLQGVDVSQDTILLHINLDWESIKL